MSVIFYEVEELGNLCAYLARGHFERAEDMADVAEDLAAYSVGNAAAFAARYAQESDAKGCSAQDILAAAQRLRAGWDLVSASRARQTLVLLTYNGPEGEGIKSFKGIRAYQRAVISLLARAYSRAYSELEQLEGRRAA